MLLTLLSFLFSLGILILIHEYGHYRIALACGVQVLRFSVGFGRPLWRWQRAGGTEFVIGSLPLGGYVKMLDGREQAVAPEARHRCFDAQPLWARIAIVAAGPLANLLLAVLLYTAVSWLGVQEPVARLAHPPADSLAEQAGLQGGERVLEAALAAEPLQPVRSFDALQWLVTRAAIDGQALRLRVQAQEQQELREVLLPLSGLNAHEVNEALLRTIGIVLPWMPPVVGQIMPDSAAARAGLLEGDVVQYVDTVTVKDAAQLRALIRAAVRDGHALAQRWQIKRNNGQQRLLLDVLPDVAQDADGTPIGRVGAYIGSAPEWVTVRDGLGSGMWRGVARTWEMSWLTLRMMGRMLTGQASVKNLSGPFTIADHAGRSANAGLAHYLTFLALVSVSLGILNLLPLPMLDGGHLMYYLWEGISGRAVSDAWMERLQRVGMAALLMLMSLALFNDIDRYASRFFG